MRYIDCEDFDEARRLRWAQGREERGLPAGEPFAGRELLPEPLGEAVEELLDAYNYMEEAERRYGVNLHWPKERCVEGFAVLRSLRRGRQF